MNNFRLHKMQSIIGEKIISRKKMPLLVVDVVLNDLEIKIDLKMMPNK